MGRTVAEGACLIEPADVILRANYTLYLRVERTRRDRFGNGEVRLYAGTECRKHGRNMTASHRARTADFSSPNLWSDWRMLAEIIGERRAGTAEERRAAEFIAQGFADAGLANIAVEPFPCRSLQAATATVHER